MGAMRDADGRVIGAGGCGRHVCVKSDYDRRRFGCQTQAMDRLPRNAIPTCPKKQTFRDRTCEITWDSKLLTERTKMARTMRRYGARDAALMDDDDNTQLRAVLSELGILSDDIETVIARLSDSGGVDSAPSNMGTGTSETAFGGSSAEQGGGSMRSYAPTDPSPVPQTPPYAGDRRRMAGDAIARLDHRVELGQMSRITANAAIRDIRQYGAPGRLSAADEKRQREMFPHAGRLGFSTYARG